MKSHKPTRQLAEQYATLKPQIKYISEATIRKKWRKLSSNHDVIRTVIHASRDRCRKRDHRGRLKHQPEVEAVLQEVTNKLISRLPLIPYPPSARADHFDHEANLERISKIEAQLTSNQHSVALLQAQIKKEERLAREDEAEINFLEQSRQSNQAFRRQQARTLHPVAQGYLRAIEPGSGQPLRSRVKVNVRSLTASMAKVVEDKHVQPTLEQLQSHLESMQSNMASVAQLRDCLDTTYWKLLEISPDLTAGTATTPAGARADVDPP